MFYILVNDETTALPRKSCFTPFHILLDSPFSVLSSLVGQLLYIEKTAII